MEATGVYWKPIWHMLEGRFELVLRMLLISAMFPAARVTSTTRCGSPTSGARFDPGELCAAADPRAARPDTNENTTDPRACATHSAYPEDLEDANIKLVSAISDIVGMSGRRILKAIIAGETNAMRLTELGSTV